MFTMDLFGGMNGDEFLLFMLEDVNVNYSAHSKFAIRTRCLQLDLLQFLLLFKPFIKNDRQ